MGIEKPLDAVVCRMMRGALDNYEARDVLFIEGAREMPTMALDSYEA